MQLYEKCSALQNFASKSLKEAVKIKEKSANK